MRHCKYYNECADKRYAICGRDGSRRKEPCFCHHYELSRWRKFLYKVFGIRPRP